MKKFLFIFFTVALLATGCNSSQQISKQTAVQIPAAQETSPVSALDQPSSVSAAAIPSAPVNATTSQYPRTMQYYVDNYNFENSDTAEMLPTAARNNLAYFISNVVPSLPDKSDAQMLAWWADIEGILGKNLWAYSNCLDQYFGPDVDCWSKGGYKSGGWQVGYGAQVYYDASDNFSSLQNVFKNIYPGNTPKAIGDNVLQQAGQDGIVYPDSLKLDEIIKNPGGITNNMSNAYWGSVLMRDLKISAQLEAPITTAWTCYGKDNGQSVTIPKWCGTWYANQKTNHSKSMKIIINTWNDIINKGS